VLDQRRRNRPARYANDELIAEAKQSVVPALAEVVQLQVREIGVLFLDERANQRWIDGDFGRRFRPDCHFMPIQPWHLGPT
jgi:hypothetical protein